MTDWDEIDALNRTCEECGECLISLCHLCLTDQRRVKLLEDKKMTLPLWLVCTLTFCAGYTFITVLHQLRRRTR